MANKAKDPDDLWRRHDLPIEKRREIDDKYDYQYSILILVFARLIKEGWIDMDDLQCLREEKIERILDLANI